MRIRPFHAWGLLAYALADLGLEGLRTAGLRVHGDPPSGLRGWASLARLTPEEVDRGLAHRYAGLGRS